MSNSAQLPSQEEAYQVIKKARRDNKEKRDKERSKSEKKEEAVEEVEEVKDEPQSAKKRKRDPLPEEIEINVNLPEPASKKAARKAKKAKTAPASTETTEANTETTGEQQEGKEEKRSQFGVWIGNLPWSATKDTLRTFLVENSEIKTEEITRVHMPPPKKIPSHFTTKPLNKGFAYVDFSTELAMYSAIALTETKMDGRALLIKNSKSFEGRPDKPKTEWEDDKLKGVKEGKPPNKRVFVGNLSFDVTREDLQAHFEQCGEIAQLHVATFEDTGKCKGYAWVTFEDIESATSAARGYVFKDESEFKGKKDADSEDEENAQKKSKKRKWWVNKLMGRELRCEFAEDATTRYQKRYGKEKKEPIEGVHPDRADNFDGDAPRQQFQRPKKQFKPRPKVDPREIRSGAAHMNAQRASQAIVASEGKKISFD
ncbi:hypothetical protein BS50DRAFT_572942 [Corynespora cassiicola Philippines]|uniref:RRM domain-containing protein n=1 Tax=Corynespora cassiicola Philippines TaxID=1448308 RepID=A0A2T2NRG2_CORCC|nr:hypothetical protein BS50DRAFT_572942 [Corynespora cassiicola Philippines]